MVERPLDRGPSPLRHSPAVRDVMTHRFALEQPIEAYDVFARASDTGALKVVLTR